MKETEKEIKKTDRVLARRGARELTLEELDIVSGAAHTTVCTAAMSTKVHTGAGDGDGCGDLNSTV